jgi:hypothetical protein
MSSKPGSFSTKSKKKMRMNKKEKKGGTLPVRDAASALASDRALRQLRFELVPKYMAGPALGIRHFDVSDLNSV